MNRVISIVSGIPMRIEFDQIDQLVLALEKVWGIIPCTYFTEPIPLFSVGDIAFSCISNITRQTTVPVDTDALKTAALEAIKQSVKLEINESGAIYLDDVLQGVVASIETPVAPVKPAVVAVEAPKEEWRVRLLTDTLLSLYKAFSRDFEKRGSAWFYEKDDCTNVWIYPGYVRINAHIVYGEFTRLNEGMK